MDNLALIKQLPLWAFQFKSSSKIKIVTRKEIEIKLIERVLKEEGFKKRLIRDPKSEIEEMFDIQLPEKISLQVLEETEDHIYLVIPNNPYAGIEELEIKQALGMDLEDIARWVLEQQKELLTSDREKQVQIVAKAWRDEEFKKSLKDNPIHTLQTILGENIESGHIINVLEETAEQVFIILPSLTERGLDESDADTSFINMSIVIGTGYTLGRTCIFNGATCTIAPFICHN